MFKTILITLGLIVLNHIGFAQNDTTIYYKGNYKPALGKQDAIRYITIKRKADNTFKISTFTKWEEKWSKSKYTNLAHVENDSTVKIFDKFTRKYTYRYYKPIGEYYYVKEYYPNGKLSVEGLSKSIIFMHWEGQVKRYYDSGNLASIERYQNNQLRGNKNWLENGKPYIDNIYNLVDVLPEFPGGLSNLNKYFSKNIKFPEEAKKMNLQGKVFVNFVIDTDGIVVGTHVSKSVHPLFDKEAMRVVAAMVNWSVGKLDGKPVKVWYTVPINFRLE